MTMTMKQIASLAGTSVSTVSKVMNGRDEKISEETRKRILKLIVEYDYRPNTLAKGLKGKKTNTIGFILPDISNPFFPEIARGIEDFAKSLDFAVVFCNTDNDVDRERECVSFLKSKMVDGLIFTRSLRNSTFKEYMEGNTPIVVVDRGIDIEAAGIGKVFIDTRAAIHDATLLLLDRGCRNIGFISAMRGSIQERYEGYLTALKERDVELNPQLVYEDDYNADTGHQGALTLLERGALDGIVCGNDLIAAGAIEAIKKQGLDIPGDIKIIGLDNIYFSKYLSPPLTTIEQPAYEMGRAAAQMLVRNILYGEPLATKELSYRMILRETV